MPIYVLHTYSWQDGPHEPVYQDSPLMTYPQAAPYSMNEDPVSTQVTYSSKKGPRPYTG